MHCDFVMRRTLLIFVGSTTSIAWSATAHAGGLPLWQEVPGIFGTQPCGGGGCYTRYMRVADIDGDDDLDIIYPNDNGGAQPLVVYENDGTGGFTDVSETAVDQYAARLRQIAVGDVDGDGDVDIYGPNATATVGALFINDGLGVFTDEGVARLPNTAIPAGSTRFGDMDGDGSLDIVVADNLSGNGIVVYLNDGAGIFSELADAVPFNPGSDLNDIDVFDVDRDFDLDIMSNAHSGANRIWINDGTGHFGDTPFSSAGGLHYGPGVCDVDGDGDLDIWIDNQGPNYTERLWINDGTGTFTDETVARVTGNPNSDDNGIVCADVDSDGDLDAVVVALSTPERLLENDGTGNFTYVPGAFSGPTDSSLWAEMGDLNGDGRIDIATGQGESGSFLNRVFMAQVGVAVDVTGPTLITWQDPPAEALEANEVLAILYAVSDDALSDNGPRLQSAYALIDPAGAATQVPAAFVGGDLFRVVLPTDQGDATVTYQLCATDPAGNTTCSADFTYDVGAGGGSGTSGSGSDGGSSSGADSTGDGGSTGGTTMGPGDSGDGSGGLPPGDGSTGTTSSPTDTDTDGSPSQDDDGGGCSCRSTGSSPASFGWWAMVLVGLSRARRSSRRGGPARRRP